MPSVSHRPQPARPRIKPLKPLREFDYSIIAERMEGILINVERDLKRRLKAALSVRDKYGIRQWSVMAIIATFAANAYRAVLYIGATTPEDAKRKPTLAVVIPAINRQLLDALFTLVYMFDDFQRRFPHYDRAGYRVSIESAAKFQRFAGQPDWREFLRNLRKQLALAAEELELTNDEKRHLNRMPYWPTPTQMKDRNSRSKPFLRWLFKWFYSDTSEQAHVGAGGLLMIGSMMLHDVFVGQDQEIIEKRTMRQYHYLHVSRTMATILAIMAELDAQFTLGNRERIGYVWKVLAENAPEAREMYDQRYAAVVGS